MSTRARRISHELMLIVLFGLMLFSARSSLADHYVVPTSSMEYTLMPGDRVLVNKTAYGLRVPFVKWQLTRGSAPRVGEVVVFDSPETGKRLIKRVVAVGGDVIEVHTGRLVLNGQPMTVDDDPPVEDLGGHLAFLNLTRPGGEYGPLEIPPGQVLVMGDFRGNSHDGRIFGVIPEKIIYGRAIAVFLRKGEGLLWKRL